MSKNVFLLGAAALVAAFGGCGKSTDVEAFSANSKQVRDATILECPGHGPDGERVIESAPAVIVQGLVDDPEPEPTCVEWERVGDNDLHLKFTGVMTHCSADWEPRATFEDGALDVILFEYNPKCGFAGCSCRKGADLIVEDLPLDEAVSLTLRQDDDCEEENPAPWQLREALDVAGAAKGTACLEPVD